VLNNGIGSERRAFRSKPFLRVSVSTNAQMLGKI
jgi:hypothetical protein